ncbi:sulfatase [Carboxylicivirga sp. M1479]|uniref:sulfatase family protein n=1 Tax=Carboxylicivirga sp. M1479 TaxID=2594476 RepID=UPI0011784186|nr:sulfatase [Carboxylicivirga sp. M1479]TRX66421.1 sulfatase [Carboxylicivirga sp. M1479]
MVNRFFSYISLFQIVCVVCLVTSLIGCGQTNTSAQKPNIIFIMSDDHATNAISAYGSHLANVASTPNIDRLAAEGAILNNCFANNSICTPSRAAILTGQFSHVNGVRTLSDQLDTTTVHLAHHLQAIGYNTALIGKWHLHSEPQGFGYWNVLPDQGLYFNPEFIEKGQDEHSDFHNRTAQTHEGYVSDIITDLAIDWLQKQAKDQPFMLMMHHKAPHALWEYHPKYKDLFKDVEIPEPASLFENMKHRSDATRDVGNTLMRLAQRMSGQIKISSVHNYDEWPTGKLNIDGLDQKQIIRAVYQKYLKDYLRTVASVDESVGRVLDYLKENDLEDNTIIIYTSDQGMFLGEHQYLDKRWMFDEAIKMPFLIRYPRAIEVKTELNSLISNVDFAPTLLDYAGANVPDNMQGRSFKSLLEGDELTDWPSSIYYRYWMHRSTTPAHYGIRTAEYKLVFYYALNLDANNYGHPDTKAAWELYDLKNDPLEMNNVYGLAEYQDVIIDLKRQLKNTKKQIGDTDEQYPELLQRLKITK